MCLKKIILTTSLIIPLLGGVPAVVSAEEDHEHEHRQHDAHVHGIASLNLALEGKEVHIEFESPAANIVGFEHEPSSKDDHAAIDKAVATLKKGNQLFKFNDQAGCQMETSKVASALLDEEHSEHEEHKDMHDEHKDDHDEHEEDVHSDIDATYHFECTAPDKLTQLTVELFEVFPGTEKLKVQYVINNKQGGAELTVADHVVKF